MLKKETKVINSGLTAYEVQQQQYEKVSPLDALDVLNRLNEVSGKMLDTDSAYFMLLCHELRDYTTFVLTSITEQKNLKQVLLETCQNRGEIMDIYDSEDGNGWNIWIKDRITGKCNMRKLFDACDFIEIV